MSDKYEQIRNIPLKDVLAMLGFTKWKSRKGGREFYGACPFHGPKHNKTSFSFDDRRYHCFSCSESGSGSIDLIMGLKKVGFEDAVKFLGGGLNDASRQTSALPENQGRETEAPAIAEEDLSQKENKPYNGVYEKHYVPSEWLRKRGLTEQTLKFFGVGEYNNPARRSAYAGKVLCPIFRFKDGVKVAYTARDIKENPEFKWLFPKGFAKSLEVFGGWHLKLDAQKRGLTLPLRVGFLVESPLCAMKYFQMGLPAVSCFGAFVSEAQLEILAQLFRGILYLPDRDKYPVVEKTTQQLASRVWIKAPQLPDNVNDPENLNREQVLALLRS